MCYFISDELSLRFHSLWKCAGVIKAEKQLNRLLAALKNSQFDERASELFHTIRTRVAIYNMCVIYGKWWCTLYDRSNRISSLWDFISHFHFQLTCVEKDGNKKV